MKSSQSILNNASRFLRSQNVQYQSPLVKNSLIGSSKYGSSKYDGFSSAKALKRGQDLSKFEGETLTAINARNNLYKINKIPGGKLADKIYTKYKKIKGSFKKGGKVKKTGVYKLHKGERVLNKKQTKKFDSKKYEKARRSVFKMGKKQY